MVNGVGGARGKGLQAVGSLRTVRGQTPADRVRPATIVSDYGSELTSRAILEWQNATGVA